MNRFDIIKLRNIFFLALIIISICFGCRKKGCTDPNADNYDPDAIKEDNSTCVYTDFNKSEMLNNICDNYIVPSYSNFNNQTSSLKDQISIFSQSPTINNFENIRNQWVQTLLSWQEVSFIDFGPAEYIILKNQVNLYPVDTALIKNNINTGNYNLEFASNYDAKGLQALDFLLFQPNMSNQQHVDYFNNSTNAMSYLINISNDLNINSQYIVDQWHSYKTTFKNNSETNAQGSSVSNLINGLCSYYETYIRKGKIGLPLGIFNGFSQQEMPELVECYYYGESLPFAKRAMESMREYINGVSYISKTNSLGFDDYMDFVGAAQNETTLSSVITNQIELILNELNQLNDPLSNEIANNKPAVNNCYSKMQQLVPYTKVDMTSALGVLITYQDNDGD